jgi:hypothetical protein
MGEQTRKMLSKLTELLSNENIKRNKWRILAFFVLWFLLLPLHEFGHYAGLRLFGIESTIHWASVEIEATTVPSIRYAETAMVVCLLLGVFLPIIVITPLFVFKKIGIIMFVALTIIALYHGLIDLQRAAALIIRLYECK